MASFYHVSNPTPAGLWRKTECGWQRREEEVRKKSAFRPTFVCTGRGGKIIININRPVYKNTTIVLTIVREYTERSEYYTRRKLNKNGAGVEIFGTKIEFWKARRISTGSDFPRICRTRNYYDNRFENATWPRIYAVRLVLVVCAVYTCTVTRYIFQL